MDNGMNRHSASPEDTVAAAAVHAHATAYVARLTRVLAALDVDAVGRIVLALERARKAGATIFLAGNGGSAATASHLANDLSIGARVDGRACLRVFSLADNLATLTALANDRGYDGVFVHQLEALFRPNDVLIAISASGNSPNVVKAVEFASQHGGTTIGFVGFDGGRLKPMCHYVAHVVTSIGEYGIVEDVHLVLNHLLTACLRQLAHEGEAR